MQHMMYREDSIIIIAICMGKQVILLQGPQRETQSSLLNLIGPLLKDNHKVGEYLEMLQIGCRHSSLLIVISLLQLFLDKSMQTKAIESLELTLKRLDSRNKKPLRCSEQDSMISTRTQRTLKEK